MEKGLKSTLLDLPEPIRFLLAGGVNSLFGYLMFALGLYVLSTPLQSVGGLVGRHFYLIIQWVMWVLSVPFGAFTLKHFVFRSQGSYRAQALRSYVVYFPAQLLASALLVVFVLLVRAVFPALASAHFPLDLSVLLAQAGAILGSTAVSYFGHKYFTFAR